MTIETNALTRLPRIFAEHSYATAGGRITAVALPLACAQWCLDLLHQHGAGVGPALLCPDHRRAFIAIPPADARRWDGAALPYLANKALACPEPSGHERLWRVQPGIDRAWPDGGLLHVAVYTWSVLTRAGLDVAGVPGE